MQYHSMELDSKIDLSNKSMTSKQSTRQEIETLADVMYELSDIASDESSNLLQ